MSAVLLSRDAREVLADARQRTLELVASVGDQDLDRVHDPLMSPLVWDLGHIAAFEDLWLAQRTGGMNPLRPDLAEVYDAAETPRFARGDLPYLRRDEAIAFMEETRGRSLAVLDRVARVGPVWEMVAQHEHQHNETMLQTLQLAEPGVYAPERRPLPEAEAASGMVRIDAGRFPLGEPDAEFAYDNERPQHEVHLPAFEIDRMPVTNGAYLAFIEDGGYRRRDLWTEQGWAWRASTGVDRPLYWTEDGRVRSFERTEPLDPDLPVMHVSWYEADAYARWRGARLPTEEEWEKVASWDEAAGEKRRFPWGDEPPDGSRANLDQLAFGPAQVGAYPTGASPYGLLGMVGDCWEWTSSDFAGYPGFRAWPYREYSEVFFGGGYKVLRGASWASRPTVARTTFRNWDHPERRQIFAGFRCVVDVPRGASVRIDVLDVRDSLADDVRAGLTSELKQLPPKYFYDERGSELFDRITTLPEYYPTRAEREILNRRAPQIVRGSRAAELVELGSGSASKTRALLYAMAGAGTLRRYVPLDVSQATLESCAADITELYPGLEVHGVVGDFGRDLARVPLGERRLFAFLGGTIGNLFPDERAACLARLRELMLPDDRLLIGTDLVKDRSVLEAAYNDSQGVTAEFNRNVLRVVNDGLGANFAPEAFEHLAFFDEANSWIEMRLRANGAQSVRIEGADLELTFEDGEEIRTEISAKFTRDAVERELTGARFALDDFFTDERGMFGVALARPDGATQGEAPSRRFP
jgi:gamma-glutamyl hercynylcysteine S-oxide synthase